MKRKPNASVRPSLSRRTMTADDVFYSFSRYTGAVEGVPEGIGSGIYAWIFKSWTKIDDLTVRCDFEAAPGQPTLLDVGRLRPLS